MDLQPVLEGELVRVQPLEPADLEPLFSVASDPLIWEQHPSKERAEREGFEAWFRTALDSGGALLVTDRADGRVIGSSRYWRFRPEPREVEIGWTFLARSHWGGQSNSDLKRLMIGHAFESGVIDTIVFRVHSLNNRSLRAVEKLGASRVGTEIDALGRGENVVFHLGRPQPG